MRKLFKFNVILFVLASFVAMGAIPSMAGENYKALYQKTIKTNDGIRHQIKVVKKKLAKAGYEKNKTAAGIMSDANDQIKYANEVRAKAEKLAKKGKYKAAYLWAYQEFQYLVKAVVKLNVINNLITSQPK